MLSMPASYDQLILLLAETQLKQRERLGWQAQYKMEDVARMMVEARSADYSL